jgi:hypothetical protein
MARFCSRCGSPQGGHAIRSATMVTPVLQQWRMLKNNLTRKEVRRVLGEPLRVDPPEPHLVDALEKWTYQYEAVRQTSQVGLPVVGLVYFAADGRLVSWQEPAWENLGTRPER